MVVEPATPIVDKDILSILHSLDNLTFANPAQMVHWNMANRENTTKTYLVKNMVLSVKMIFQTIIQFHKVKSYHLIGVTRTTLPMIKIAKYLCPQKTAINAILNFCDRNQLQSWCHLT